MNQLFGLQHRGDGYLSYTRGQARGVGVCFCRCVLTQKGLAAMRALSVVVKGDFIIHELRVGTCHVLLDRS